MPDSDPTPFEGFDVPYYTQTPNQVFDLLLRPGTLTEAELRVLLYIVRRTFGFGKSADAISLGQLTDGIVTQDGRRLDWGAGVSRPAASRAVKGLEAKGIITVRRQRDVRGGDAVNLYSVRWRVSQGLTSVTPLGTESNPPGNATQPEGVAEDNPQKKVQNKEEQKEEEAGSPSASASSTPPPYSPVIAGAILDLARSLRDDLAGPGAVAQALALWQRSGWSEPQFVAALQAAQGRSRKLAAVLAALAQRVNSEQ